MKKKVLHLFGKWSDSVIPTTTNANICSEKNNLLSKFCPSNNSEYNILLFQRTRVQNHDDLWHACSDPKTKEKEKKEAGSNETS